MIQERCLSNVAYLLEVNLSLMKTNKHQHQTKKHFPIICMNASGLVTSYRVHVELPPTRPRENDAERHLPLQSIASPTNWLGINRHANTAPRG